MPVDIGYAMTLTPEKAVAYFESKGYVLGFNWRDVKDSAHASAFTVAGILKQDVLGDIKTSLTATLKNGSTLTQFKDDLLPTLARKGWVGKGLRASPDGELEGKQILPYRLDTIFRTNMQSSYMAGRYQRMRENADSRPWWQYDAVMDSRTRPAHAALNGRIFRYDDPFWDTFWPPNGYNCRCRVRALSEQQAEKHDTGPETSDDRLVAIEQPYGTDGELRRVTAYRDPKSGQVTTPDAGFHLNPGKGYLENLGDQLLKRAVTADVKTAALAVDETLSNARLVSALNRDTGHWIQQVSAGKQARGEWRHVGALLPGVVDALSLKGVAPDSAVITLTDSNLLHATRDSKQGELPEGFWQSLVSRLRHPSAVIWDRQQAKPALMYVFSLDPLVGKLVVYIDSQIKVRDALTGKREKVKTNMIRTGKVLTDGTALKNSGVYDLLWGSLD
jgi:SPP1 gp7 family putative phage head morphogenesis protein